MSKKRLAVLTMLVVMLLLLNIPASAQVVGTAGVTAASSSAFAASTTGFGAFGGFGFPFNWGFSPFGVGCWPFNWALGGGWGPFPFLSWNKFSPGFFGITGAFPFSPCFLGGCGLYQGVPFIIGSEGGGCPTLGWDISPWAFGVQSCVRSLPLYFGAHGFGFPKSLGCWRFGLIPPLCGAPLPAIAPAIAPPLPAIAPPLPAIAPAIAPPLPAIAPPLPAIAPVSAPCAPPVAAPIASAPPVANAPLSGIAKSIAKAAVDQGVPFIIGSEGGGCPTLGWDISPWAFGVQSCVRSLPLYFGAHGFGFPKSLGCWRFGLIPPICGP